MMQTVTIQIGNTDDKLTQNKWADFVSVMKIAIERSVLQVHFFGGSENYARWQNVCWVCADDGVLPGLKNDCSAVLLSGSVASHSGNESPPVTSQAQETIPMKKYLILLILVPVLYVLSFGPALWWFPPPNDHYGHPDQCWFGRIYWPVGVAIFNSPKPFYTAGVWWAGLGLTADDPMRWMPISKPDENGCHVWYGIYHPRIGERKK